MADYRSAKSSRNKNRRVVKVRPPPERSSYEGFWWKANKPDVHEAVLGYYRQLKTDQATRAYENRKNIVLYGEDPQTFGRPPGTMPGASRTEAAIAALKNPIHREAITLNICQMAVDTLCAKVSKTKPRAAFLTEGGDYSQKKRAKRKEKFVRGVYYEEDLYPKSQEAFRDGLVCDVGVLKLYALNGRICGERILPGELFWDASDGKYGAPRSIAQARVVAREVLAEDYPELAKKIAKAEAPDTDMVHTGSLADQVLVVEAWHLPSHADAADGRHVMAINNTSIIDEPWTRERFPFAIFRWSKKMEGFGGQGAVERLRARQLSINRKLKTIDSVLRMHANPKWMVNDLANVPDNHLSNAVDAIIRYSGQVPPHLAVPPPLARELFDTVLHDVDWSFRLVGLNDQAIAGLKPPGIDSGVARREHEDVLAERHILTGQAWEAFHMEIARQVLELAKEISEEKDEKGKALYPDLSVRAPDKRGRFERVAWKDVAMAEDAYVMQAYPTSSLPTTPAAKKQAVQEWLEAGFVDRFEARQLLDFPDLEASNNVAFAAQEDIEAQVERFLDGGDYEPPEPEQDLAYGLKRMQSAYLRGRTDGVPKERLDNLLNWLRTAKKMMDAAMPPPAPPALPPGMPLPPGMMPPGAAPGLPAMPGLPPGAPPIPPLAGPTPPPQI